MKRLLLFLLLASSVFGQTGSITLDKDGNVIKPAVVNFPTPIPLKLNGVTINALPGNSKYWGTDSGGNLGYFNITSGAIVGGFTAHFSRGGAAIQANDVLVTPWTCPYSGTITGYSISADTGTCTIKTWAKDNSTSIPTIADVISTSGVSLSTGTHIRSSTVSDFSPTAVAAGKMFMAQVTAVSGNPTDITFQVEITR